LAPQSQIPQKNLAAEGCGFNSCCCCYFPMTVGTAWPSLSHHSQIPSGCDATTPPLPEATSAHIHRRTWSTVELLQLGLLTLVVSWSWISQFLHQARTVRPLCWTRGGSNFHSGPRKANPTKEASQQKVVSSIPAVASASLSLADMSTTAGAA
jgi:hypothetical protein